MRTLSNGLVLIEFKGNAPLMRVMGVEPFHALKLLNDEQAKSRDDKNYVPEVTLAPIPDGVESFEFIAPETAHAEVVQEHDALALIEIPADYKETTPVKLVKLAKQFDPAVSSAEAALLIIENELARREQKKPKE